MIARIAAVLILAAAALAPAHAGRPSYPFSMTTVAEGSHHVVVLANDGPSPVTAVIALNGSNVYSDRVWPATVVVLPHSRETVGRLYVANPLLPSQHRLVGDWELGDIYAQPSPDTVYRLPYPDGQKHPITQAPGGVIRTHNTPDTANAVDFSMPTGTPVLAARGGVVVEITQGYTEGGLDPSLRNKANSVTVLHDDGTTALYGHLAPSQPSVSVGQRIQAGHAVGFAGNTGFSTAPHLHFAVLRPVVDQATGRVLRESIPVKFYVGSQATAFVPKMGMEVKAKYAAGAQSVDRLTAIEETQRMGWIAWGIAVIFFSGLGLFLIALRRIRAERASAG